MCSDRIIWYQGQKVRKLMQACLQEDFWPLDPPKTWVSSHFSKKNERITNVFEDCESAKHVAIWYQRGQNTFWPQHHFSIIHIIIERCYHEFFLLTKEAFLRCPADDRRKHCQAADSICASTPCRKSVSAALQHCWQYCCGQLCQQKQLTLAMFLSFLIMIWTIYGMQTRTFAP